ncbi:MAG: ribose 5-phosphate isomerase B [Firmicutes bacterium]|nr:ribose 5-phosphate isomerase B [Bacillota bacterium]
MALIMIIIGSDHGGFKLKGELKNFLEEKGKTVIDCGVFNEESVDYPDIAQLVCNRLFEKKASFAVLICGTGIGISIAANKIKGIRAALICNEFSAKMASEHNNANVVCFGGRTTNFDSAAKMLDVFMTSKFQGGRHQARVDKIMSIGECNNEKTR